ncbi:MAG: bi-domain-containing oxidoreductase [Anaerolineales bacterium]|nr:bi-domain-containing oxidoreductase [Chloroflexota bacterium]MBL6980304.1 bi-domain-containing oxidoreductase [Anaerolineales bacterium]
MKQLLQNLRTGETSIAEVPTPTPKPGTALVRTAASLVSAGTERMLVEFAEKSLVGKARSRPDLVRQVVDKARREGLLTTVDAAFNRLDQPMPLGYSSAGTIVALGKGFQGFKVGDRVACAGGGYAVHAEYAVVPKNLLAHLPTNVNFESAAFATLGAIAMHGFRLARLQVGDRVAVIGLGLLGLLTVGIAHAAGCHVFGVDIDPERVELARSAGAEAVTRDQAEEASLSFSRGHGVDSVLICADTSSDDPVNLAGAIARDKANIVAVGAVGLNIPRREYFQKELNFINSRSYGPGRYDPDYEENGQDYPIGYVRWTEGRNIESIVDLMGTGRLDVASLITHRFPIEQAPQAYQLITGKTEETFLGVLLTYPESAEYESRSVKIPLSVPSPAHRASHIALGVLGAGNFATAVMLPAVSKIPEVEMVGIVSGSGLSAQHAGKKFSFLYVASDSTQIVEDPDINTLAILTRHNLHADQIVAALEAGKHVFVEKPLAVSREQLAIVKEKLSANSSQLLTVGFNRRFAPLALKMKAFIAKRKEPLVAHFRVNAGFIPLTHWLHDPTEGGGRIIGEGCHFVDFLAFLVGESPSSVTAQATPDAGRYREDNAVLTFSFSDGSLGAITYLANGDKSFPKERVEVFAGGRVAVLDDFRTLEMVHDGQRQLERSRLRQDKGHRAVWEVFANAIITGGPPPIPYNQLFGVTEATFAAVEALRSGEKVIISNEN